MPGKGEKVTNAQIADVLDEVADLLQVQGANPHRIRAYQNAASAARSLEDALEDLYFRGGRKRLQSLPNIGEGISALIAEMVETGRSSLLEQLRGQVTPRDLFARVPGIGEALADRVASELGIRTLEELEQAVHDGRLEAVEGFGEKRVETVRTALAGILSRAVQRRAHGAAPAEPAPEEPPPVVLLLAVDSEYRQKARGGDLPTIAPRRFNPEGEAWLPVLDTERDGWTFTALYSNTARAHELGMTHDWVVIYFKRPGQREDQVTVVTETSGSLEGRRVVRGREAESRRFYQGN